MKQLYYASFIGSEFGSNLGHLLTRQLAVVYNACNQLITLGLLLVAILEPRCLLNQARREDILGQRRFIETAIISLVQFADLVLESIDLHASESGDLLSLTAWRFDLSHQSFDFFCKYLLG